MNDYQLIGTILAGLAIAFLIGTFVVLRNKRK